MASESGQSSKKRRFVPSGPVLPLPVLMLVTDRHLAGGEDRLVETVAEAVQAGVNVVQLREKDLGAERLLPLARRLRDVTRGHAVLLINGALDVVKEVGADGLHLPEDADPPDPPWTFIWGRSAHSAQGAMHAMGGAARYVILGPIFETRSHPDAEPLGLDVIEEVCGWALVPIIGIGGITPANAADVLRAGASGVAVISAILGERSPSGAARMLREALDVAYQKTNRSGSVWSPSP